MKFKGFSYEDGKTVSVAYLDGYNFGDKLLEGVSFKCEINDEGELTASFTNPEGSYEKGLNQKKWVKEAQAYAVDNDIFSEKPDLTGEDLFLEPVDSFA